MSREIPIHFFQEFRQLEKNLVEIPGLIQMKIIDFQGHSRVLPS